MPRLSYANVVATLALFVALSGSAYALTITGKQIKDNTVTSADIRQGTVSAADLGTGSVLGAKLAAGAVSGGKIANGTITADKLAGNISASKFDAITTVKLNGDGTEVVTSAPTSIPMGIDTSVTVSCTSGHVTGGGYDTTASLSIAAIKSYPILGSPDSWRVVFNNSGAPANATVYAVCR